jgi:hypothetical protein
MNVSRLSPWRTWACLAIAAGAATGCGNLTGGGWGEAHVYATGDAPEPSPQPAAVSAEGPAQAPLIPIIGALDVHFSAYLTADDGATFWIGLDELRAQVAIDGSDEQLLKIQNLPEDHYTEIRLHFTGVAADVVSGLPVLGTVSVALDSTAIVSRPIDLNIRDDAQVDLLIDLNAPAWLSTADPLTLTVAEAVFAALVEVSLR